MSGINSNNSQKFTSGKIKGATLITGGAYLGAKSITSGLRRALGVRIETHTTSTANAKNIIKSGKILDPNYGGTGAARVMDSFGDNSKKFVHITGFHKDWKKILSENKDKYEAAIEMMGSKNLVDTAKKFENTPVETMLKSIFRKSQKMLYSIMSILNIKSQETLFDDLAQHFGSAGETIKTSAKILTGTGAKTFYVGGTDKYFNDNFIPDINDFALKSDKSIKVAKTKIGAIIESLKREGLSGIKQNKGRVAFGIAIFSTLAFASYKLIKHGCKLISNKKEEQKDDNVK